MFRIEVKCLSVQSFVNLLFAFQSTKFYAIWYQKANYVKPEFQTNFLKLLSTPWILEVKMFLNALILFKFLLLQKYVNDTINSMWFFPNNMKGSWLLNQLFALTLELFFYSGRFSGRSGGPGGSRPGGMRGRPSGGGSRGGSSGGRPMGGSRGMSGSRGSSSTRTGTGSRGTGSRDTSSMRSSSGPGRGGGGARPPQTDRPSGGPRSMDRGGPPRWSGPGGGGTGGTYMPSNWD